MSANGGAVRRGRVRRPRRSGRLVRHADVHDGRPAGYERPREPRPGPERHPEFRLRVPAASHHREPGAGRRPQGRRGVRSADRARHSRRPGDRRAPRDRRMSWCSASCRSTARFIRRAACLPIAAAARRDGLAGVLLPRSNAGEAALVDGLDVLAGVVARRSGQRAQPSVDGRADAAAPPHAAGRHRLPDLADVRGQLLARRALEIACAGGHNLLLVGSAWRRQNHDGATCPRDSSAADVRRSARGHGRSLGGGPAAERLRARRGSAVSRAASHDFERGAGWRRSRSRARAR